MKFDGCLAFFRPDQSKPRFWAVGPCITGGTRCREAGFVAFIDSPFFRKPGNPGFAELAKHQDASFAFLKHDEIWSTTTGQIHFPQVAPPHGTFELRFGENAVDALFALDGELKGRAAEFNNAAMGRYFELC